MLSNGFSGLGGGDGEFLLKPYSLLGIGAQGGDKMKWCLVGSGSLIFVLSIKLSAVLMALISPGRSRVYGKSRPPKRAAVFLWTAA